MTHRTTVIADHHKHVFVCQVLDHETGEVERATLESRREVLRPFVEALPGPVQLFVEACRSWEWVSDLCEELGIEFHLVDPRQMPEIAKSHKKSDRADVEAMVQRFTVCGELPESRVATRLERELRGLTRELSGLRSEHRILLNKIHAAVDAHGCPGDKRKFRCPEWRASLRAELTPDAWLLVEMLLLRWDFVNAQRDVVEQRVTEVASSREEYRLLQTVPGIGPVIAATILAEVPRADEFKSSRQFAAFTGLVPRVRSSAGKAKYGSITKAGPRDLRWALGQAVMVGHFAKEPTPAVVLHRRKRAKGKAYKVALCAGANKLARMVWAMLTQRTEYQPSSA